MHIKRDHLDNDFADVLKALQVRHAQSIAPLMKRLHFRSHQVLFHEIYHYWQGLRLPFLFRYATMAFRQTFLVFKDLSDDNGDFHKWSCFLPELERLNVQLRIGFEPEGHIFWGGTDATVTSKTTCQLQLTPLDLLECAASLAEFQVTTVPEQCTDPIALRRWAKRNPASHDHGYDFDHHHDSDRCRCYVNS